MVQENNMANYKTGAQRYNDRMDKIFERSKALGHTSLHPQSPKEIAHNKKEYAKSKALENKKK